MSEPERDRARHAHWMVAVFGAGNFCLGDTAFDRSEFERAELTPLYGEDPVRIRVKTAEDIVLRKLEWYRRAIDAPRYHATLAWPCDPARCSASTRSSPRSEG